MMASGDDDALVLVDPRTGAVVGDLPCTPVASIASQVDAARVAGALWAARPLLDRMAVVRSLGAALLARGGDLVAVLGAEIGKPPGEAWTSEVVTLGELFDHWLAVVEDELEPRALDLNLVNYPGKRVEVVSEPLGVVGLIMPWNYPVHLPMRTIVPALLVGNAVVFKPSEHAARCGALLAEVFAAVLPPGLVVTIQGGPPQGAAIIAAGVDKVVFTGSVAGGRAVARQAAELLIPTALELGSKDAAIVLHDAKLGRAVEGVLWGAFHNAGQDCASVERALVDHRIVGPFTEALVARARELRLGDDIGPLIDARAVARVHAQVLDAVARGATVRCGGQPVDGGFFYPATVLTGVPTDCALWQEETFGPVLPIAAFEGEDQAVAMADDSQYGLCVSVWTRDVARGEALARRVRCGVSYVNNCCFSGPMGGAAWGGRKHSGYGVTGSVFGLHGLVQPRTVVVDRFFGQKELWWYPYTPALTTMAEGLVELGRSGGARFTGLRKMLGGLIGRWKTS
ncbi:MAG: aldehyde dehydrogenase family protein [Myxococcales bacterium]|nr:aldehyde dehydrogenase family protein [Myxococcales bacterium]